MGDTQSAQRESKEDAVAEEQSSQADDVQTEPTIEDTDNKPLQNNGQISGMKGKAAEADGHCEDEVVVVDCDTSSALVSPEENVPETEEPLKEEETPLENVEINEKESPDADESEPSDITETEAKLNEINEGFKKFFNNIGLKFTVKKGSGEKVQTASDVPIETNEGEPSSPDDVKETTKETISESAEQNIDPSMVYETADNDSTTCPTLTDMTSEDLLENTEEKNTGTTEGKEEDASDKVVEALATSTPVGEEEKMPHEDNMPEKELDATSPTAVEEEVVSPIKRFFTTGIFSGLRKKKKPADNDKANEINETTEKDVVGIEKQEALEKTGETEQDQQQVKDFRPDIETATGVFEQKENVLKEEILPATRDTNLSPEGPEMRKNAPEEKSPSGEPSKSVSEPEILSSQEKVKVQGSPLKRLLSGSSFKKLSKKQRDKKSSDQKLTDSGEQLGDQLSLSAESAKHQREESPSQSHGEVAAEEDGTWASFKKLVTPKKHIKKASPSNEEAVITGSTEEPKPSDGEQISDASTEETKKRKDSSVSWDAFLCGSGKKRSRKTSDSEDETPRIEGDENRSDGEARHSAESPIETSNEGDELVACFPEQAGSPSEGDGGSTWKSLKKLVTPKRKAKDEEESKDNIPSDSESNKTDSSFSIKKLLPGRKKRKPTEKQEQGSSDEADKEVGSDDEDSETPAVVPLSEFDTFEREDQVQIQAVIENHMPKAVDFEPQQDLSDQIIEPALPSDSPPTEPQKVQDTDNASGNQASATSASNEEHDDQTEFISKYQQLSDIPEEGVIDESVATPVSFTEEAPRDDTIAEDLIELTSEAITAPEPVDITLADETEMVSAVSQLTDSSKTSGNTTPVPAEHDVKDTETLLHQVVETISMTPNDELVCSHEVRTEQIVSSLSPQILETAAQDEATVLTLHQTVDATVICTGVTAKEFDAINVLAATAQMESASEVSEVMSTEALSELTTEEFDTAEIAVDEVYQANVSATQMENLPEVNEGISTEPLSELPTEEFDTAEIVVDEVYQANISQEILKEFKSNNEIQPLAECIPEANEAASTELLPEDETIGTAQVFLDETNQAETQSPEITSHKADSNVAVTEKNENEIAVQMGEVLLQQEQIIKNDTDQVEIHDEVVEEVQKSTAVPAATLQLKEESVQMIEKPIVNIEGDKEGDFQVIKMDPAEVEHVPVPEVSTHGVKDAMVEKEYELQAHSYVEEGTVKEFEEQLILEEIREPETDITITLVKPETESEAAEELAQTVKEVQITENIIEDVSEDVKVEDEDHIPQVVDELQTLTAVNIASVNLEPNGVQVLEKQVKSEDIPAHCVDNAIASAVDEPLHEAHLSEVNVELEQEGDFQGATMDTAEVELVPLPEVSTHGVKDVMVETDLEIQACRYVGEGTVMELEEKVLLEHIPKPETDSTMSSVKPETGSENVVELDQTVKITEDQIIENIIEDVQRDVKFEDEYHIPEVVDELQTLTAVNMAYVKLEPSRVEVLEKQVISEDTTAPCVDNAIASVSDKPLHEVHLTQLNVAVENKDELPGADFEAASIKHASAVQIITENQKDLITSIPNTVMERTSNILVPCIVKVAKVESIEATESATALTPAMTNDITETAKDSIVFMEMQAPSIQCKDDHRIQVQVVDVDLQSAETTVETMLEVGVTEGIPVIDVCHDMPNIVNNQFTTSVAIFSRGDTEEEIIHGANEVITQDLTQGVKQHTPEALPKFPAPAPETKEMAESELSEASVQKLPYDSAWTFRERQGEEPITTSVNSTSTTEQEVSGEQMHTPYVSESLDVPVHGLKEDLEETNVEFKKSDTGIKAEDSTCLSEELVAKELQDDAMEAKRSQTALCQVAARSDPGLVVPQNTGLISTVGNVESPSSLSLEFKLNIQFGQAKASDPELPIVETAKPLKPAEKQTETSEVAIQAEITETTRERAVLLNPPVLLEIGTQAMQRAELIEEVKPIERENTSRSELSEVSVRATETTQPFIQVQTRERVVIRSETQLGGVCIPGNKVVEPVQQTEEEHDQDVWLDAEESIDTPASTGTVTHDSVEIQETQTAKCDAEKETLGHECKMAPHSHTGEAERQPKMPKIGVTCEIESESETDFAVALEHPESACASITITEWDQSHST